MTALRGGAVLMALTLGTAVRAEAVAMPMQRCAAAKLRAAARNTGATLLCHKRALVAGTAVKPECLAKAAATFFLKFSRIESLGGCATTNDASQVDGAVDACVGTLVSLLPPVSTTTTTTTTTSTITTTTATTTSAAPTCPTTTTTTTTTTTADPSSTTTSTAPSAVCFAPFGVPCGSCGTGVCVEVVAPIGACVDPTPVGPCAPASPLCAPDELARDPGTGCACYALCF